MDSATAPDPSDDDRDPLAPAAAERPRLPSLLFKGLVAAACAGSVVGVIDGLLALAVGHHVVRPSDLPWVALFYASWFLPGGLIAAVLALAFEWRNRALSLLVGLGATLFFVGAFANVRLLPDFLSAVSLFADLVLLVLTLLWFRRVYFGPGDDRIRIARYVAAAFCAWAVAFGGSFAGNGDGGPAVVAAVRPGTPRPNVLVFLVDTLRADHLGCYGYDRPTSPEIDAFAKESVVFEECRAPASWTKPSVASLMTSLYPSEHACVQQNEILVDEAHTLPEVFRAAGWRTGAFSDNPFVSPEFGFGQGFDHFDAARPSVVANGTLLGKVLFMLKALSLTGKPFGVGDRAYRGVGTLVDGEAGLLRFVDAAKGEPWFAFVQAMEPHLPYEPDRADATAFGYPQAEPYRAPPKFNGALPFQTAPDPEPGVRDRIVALYDAEIRGISRAFGKLLDELRARGVYENTIIVLTADHGEEFHEHGGWTHGHSLHREVVHVPLIVRLPDSLGPSAGRGRGRRVQHPCSLLDVYPTLTDAAAVDDPGLAAAPELRASLAPQCLPATSDAGGTAYLPITRAVYGEVDSGPVRLRSIRKGRWLLLRAESLLDIRAELYDVVSDPLETRNRVDVQDVAVDTLRRELTQAFQALEQRSLAGQSREIDAKTKSDITRLGYTGGDPDAPGRPPDDPNGTDANGADANGGDPPEGPKRR